jgi:hypothetical protein
MEKKFIKKLLLISIWIISLPPYDLSLHDKKYFLWYDHIFYVFNIIALSDKQLQNS